MTLKRIHIGHLGIEEVQEMYCAVWWPGVMQHNSCKIAQLIFLPKKQAGEGAVDYDTNTEVSMAGGRYRSFELNKSNYLLVVDYFSRYPEVIKLSSITLASVISSLKSVFSRHGISEIVRSDNGSQYSSSEFISFASSYGFQHLISSLKFPQTRYSCLSGHI